MKILITGGAGFISTNIEIEALNRGHNVIAFDNLWRPRISDNIKYMESKYKDKYKFIWGDVRNAEDLEMLEKIDAIIHMAANPGAITSVYYPVYDFRSNAIGTFNVLEFARKRKLPFIYASTTKTMSDIFNEWPMEETETRYIPKNIVQADDSLVRLLSPGLTIDKQGNVLSINEKFPIDGYCKYGHSPYGISKLTGELYAQEYYVTFKLPVVIMRMSCIYGLFQKGIEEQGWVAWFLKQIGYGNRELNIFGDGKQVRDLLDGRDVARAYINALESISDVQGNIFTIGGGVKFNYSLLEVINKIEEITGKKAKLTFKDKRPADQDWFILCNKKCKELLNWEPKIGLEQALKDMISQYERK